MLTFQSTSGDPATGTLILGQPLDELQAPLAGSTFTTDGFTFDLVSAIWDGDTGRTLENFSPDLTSSALLDLIPQNQPDQPFALDIFTSGGSGGGDGEWVVSTSASGVPETGSTLAMLGLGLAGCAGLGFRFSRANAPSRCCL